MDGLAANRNVQINQNNETFEDRKERIFLCIDRFQLFGLLVIFVIAMG